MNTRETVLPTKNISNMPKRRKDADTILNRFVWLYKKLIKIEKELHKIQEECPEKTRCYLRYGWELQQPYGHGFPILGEITDWEHALADFYTDQANQLLREREALLEKMYCLASRYYEVSGETATISWRYAPHLRKPWFKKST